MSEPTFKLNLPEPDEHARKAKAIQNSLQFPCGCPVCSAGSPALCLNDCVRNGRAKRYEHERRNKN
jgi:hypothetical protein